MNPLVKFLIILVIALELTFLKSVTLNLIVIVSSALLLLTMRLTWRQWAYLMLLPALPALGSWFSLMYYGTGDHVHMAWVLLTRVYAYVWLGSLFTLKLTTQRDLFLATLEQNAHVPTTFVYAMIGVFNFLPLVRQQIQTIRTAAYMRGENWQVWHAQLYFKAVLSAIRWSQALAQGMVSHGFTENASRSIVNRIHIPNWQYGVGIIILLIFQLLCIPQWW
jgi:energy-coupling factor transport system permease protein